MKLHRLLILLFVALAIAQAAPPAKLANMAWLVDGVWTADASAMGNGMRRIETRYTWSDNNSFLRFNTHFVTDKAELKTYDGNFFWSPAESSIHMWYADSDGTLFEGPVSIIGDSMQMLFRGTDFDGKMADLRVIVTRNNADLYRWTLSEKSGSVWKELAALDYARK